MTDRRPQDVLTGLRQTRRSMGDGTLGGRVRAATPVCDRIDQPGVVRSRVIDQTDPGDGALAGNAPLVLTVVASDVEVPSDDEGFVAFDEVQRQQLVPWEGPSDEIVWPIGGSVFFYVEGAWDDLDPGTTFAEVLVDGVAVWNCWINSSPTGITVTVEAVEIDVPDDTPTLIEFTGEVRNQDVNVALPSNQIIWPVAGVIQAYVHGRWDVLDDPSQFEFEVLLDDEPVWPDL